MIRILMIMTVLGLASCGPNAMTDKMDNFFEGDQRRSNYPDRPPPPRPPQPYNRY